MNLAVIPARGGSKRIPRKNIKSFCGKPIIAWSIEAAKKSNCFDRIIVSTDDPEISAISQSCGADVPFTRPMELADEYTTTLSVINHAITWFADNGNRPDFTCCIYATAPFITADDLIGGLDLLKESHGDYSFPVTNYPFPIQRALRINNKGFVEMLNPQFYNTRSQDLIESYHDAGQFYWGKTSSWLLNKPIFSSLSMPILLPSHRVQDIDNLNDWLRAELLFEALRKMSNES